MRALRSLRYRTLMVVVAVVVLPLFWVWVAGTFESSGAPLRRLLTAAATEAVSTDGDLDEVARRYGVWMRIVAPDGAITHHDHAPRGTVLEPVADPFYGPGGQPDLRDVDGQLPPLVERPEVIAATATPEARCGVVQRACCWCAPPPRSPPTVGSSTSRGDPRGWSDPCTKSGSSSPR